MAGAVALLLVVLAVYGWAWASVDRSTIARAMWWMEADVGDQYRFPASAIRAGDDASPLPAGVEIDLSAALPAGAGRGAGFDGFLGETDTLAFLVVHEDRLVYERYLERSRSADPADLVLRREVVRVATLV